jgi:OmcA/MtrC family decaheme c-type cytochrome
MTKVGCTSQKSSGNWTRWFAVSVLLVSTSGVFAEEPCDYMQPESCVICHSGAGEKNHQAVYNQYTDASAFAVTIDSVVSVPSADPTKFDTTMTFTIKENGAPYVDVAGLPSLKQKTFYTVQYDSTKRQFINSKSFSASTATPTATPGQYTVTATGLAFAPEASNGDVYLYIAKDQLAVESIGKGHYALYDNMLNVGKTYGDADTYESTANVSACEKCHGTPYAKHGYRMAKVSGLPDFEACKNCHYDTRVGSDQGWQILADNPARYAQILAGDAMTAAEKTKYAYTASVMNDTHMSHAMEFPYPQSMSNCATCHEGKLNKVLTDANFRIEVCKSCHPVDGPAEGTETNRAPALKTIMPAAIHAGMDLNTKNCAGCHRDGGIASSFKRIHNGYNPVIYADALGTKYSEVFTVSIDDALLTGNVLDIKFSAKKNVEKTKLQASDIIPTVLVGLYGYDTKDFIVSPHSSDANKQRFLEFPIDGKTTNPRFTVVKAENGSWEVTADLSMWADMIATGSVKRAEIAVMPLLAKIVGEIDSHENGETDDSAYALNAVSRTFDLVANGFDDGFYKPIVKIADGCNTCHDALATTFHSPDRGGNIVVCRLCHVTTSGGSHLEMQSRSIDSYVHAIHSFQAFDIGDVNFADPVAAMRYDLHIEHEYPNFTIMNCESCHNKGAFEVPDQSKSLPGLLSKSDSLQNWDRNIGSVPGYITGPASRACGSCHRARMINEDEAGELVSFNQHTKQGGYLIKEGANSAETQGLLTTVIDFIMALFK